MTCQLTKPQVEKATQARFRYEHAAVEARHQRDIAISAAWLAFEQKMAGEWALYQAAIKPFEEAIQASLLDKEELGSEEDRT